MAIMALALWNPKAVRERVFEDASVTKMFDGNA